MKSEADTNDAGLIFVCTASEAMLQLVAATEVQTAEATEMASDL